MTNHNIRTTPDVYRDREMLIKMLNDTSNIDLSIALISMPTNFLKQLHHDCELIINLKESNPGKKDE